MFVKTLVNVTLKRVCKYYLNEIYIQRKKYDEFGRNTKLDSGLVSVGTTTGSSRQSMMCMHSHPQCHTTSSFYTVIWIVTKIMFKQMLGSKKSPFFQIHYRGCSLNTGHGRPTFLNMHFSHLLWQMLHITLLSFFESLVLSHSQNSVRDKYLAIHAITISSVVCFETSWTEQSYFKIIKFICSIVDWTL